MEGCEGDDLLSLAHEHDIDLEGTEPCIGNLADRQALVNALSLVRHVMLFSTPSHSTPFLRLMTRKMTCWTWRLVSRTRESWCHL